MNVRTHLTISAVELRIRVYFSASHTTQARVCDVFSMCIWLHMENGLQVKENKNAYI